MIQLLENATRHGLDPNDYHLDELRRCVAATRPEHRARLDVLLSDALMGYSRDVRRGRADLSNLDRQWHHDPPPFDPVGFVDTLTHQPDPARHLAELPPPHEGYQRLSEALQALVRKRHTGRTTWPQLPDGPILEAGDTHPQVALLRESLARDGFAPVPDPEKNPEFFDTALADTLQAAQRRFGLNADAILGPVTRRALNRTLAERIEQVQLNMDRWRWLPDDPGERYILVNLARFRLDLIENGESVMTQKVIVGKPYLSTPAFAGEMTYLVFNPYWEIPPNLGRRSVVPRQLENPDYFEKAGIEILSGWNNPERIPVNQANLRAHQQKRENYRLRQAPGPKNALGNVKFMFPNKFNVYLHDTPDRELFDHNVRTFSSGCVRVEKPLDLAQRILAEDGMPPAEVASRFNGAPDQTIALDNPVPVYLGYWTAWVDDAGRLVFADDVYGRDEELLENRYGAQYAGGGEKVHTASAQP